MSIAAKRRPIVPLGALALVVATVSAFAAPADAKPKPPTPFTTTTIVVQKSIGGITLGSTEAKASRGFPNKDCRPGGCSYSAGSGNKAYTVYFQTAAASAHATPHVANIAITADGFAPAAEELKTNRGIGIGSTVHQLKKAYPGVKGSTADGAFYLGSGDHVTTFSVDKGRIDGIGMRNQHLG